MIISHAHKFIFIKTTKTAGTSIEVDLNGLLGPDDIATPIFPAEPAHEPKNYKIKKHFGLVTRQFRNHMSAVEVRALVDRDIWKTYFKFCVEREPVDKTVSYFSMLKNSPDHGKKLKHRSFANYVESNDFPIDTKKYTDQAGNLIVDRILRYENLSQELSEIANLLGFKFNLSATAKSGWRQDIEVTDHQKDIIYQAFASSNEFTGYSR